MQMQLRYEIEISWKLKFNSVVIINQDVVQAICVHKRMH